MPWTKIDTLRGATGQTGAAGVAGQNGSNGTNGSNGAAGAAATLSVGSVSTGAAGSSATVTNAGTTAAAVLNFSIPKGDVGAAGSNGTNGTNGANAAQPTTQSLTPSTNFTITPAAGANPTRTFTFVSASTNNITATLGETGISLGSELTITNTGATNSFYVTDSAGVSEQSGNFTVGPGDCISYIYGPAAWYETGRSNN